MKHFVSIGGGFSSTILLLERVIEKYGKASVYPVIAAIRNEHSDLWRLVDAAETLTGVHITKISWHPRYRYLVDAPPSWWPEIWDAFEHAKMMGSTQRDTCSSILKRGTITAYVKDNFAPEDTTMHVGITADEIDRAIAIRGNWKQLGYQVEFDLADDPPTTKSKSEQCMERLGWVPALYQEPKIKATNSGKVHARHNNCGGFCVKAGYAQLATLLLNDPITYWYHAIRERMFQLEHNTTATITRESEVIMGKRVYTSLSLYEFATRVYARQRQGVQESLFQDAPACVWCGAI